MCICENMAWCWLEMSINMHVVNNLISNSPKVRNALPTMGLGGGAPIAEWPRALNCALVDSQLQKVQIPLNEAWVTGDMGLDSFQVLSFNDNRLVIIWRGSSMMADMLMVMRDYYRSL